MIQVIVVVSLMITGVFIAFQQGNVFSFIRVWCANQLDKALGLKWSRYVQKPLWDCLPCMASVWGVAFGFVFLSDWRIIIVVLAVCGLNALFAKAFFEEEEPVDQLGPHINNHFS